MKNKNNIIWGWTFIALAAIIALNQFSIFDVGILRILISVLMIPLIITSIKGVNFYGIFMPLALIAILLLKPLGILILEPGYVILTSLFLSTGLTFLFPRKNSKNEYNFQEILTLENEGVFNIVTKFSGTVQYVKTDQLKRVNVELSFAGGKVFLDNAQMAGDCAEIVVHMNFSGLELYVPRGWKVEDHVNFTLGGSEIKGTPPMQPEKILVLTGNANLSGITILYI